MKLPIAFCYILKKLLLAFCVITPIVILMVWIAMSIKYVDLIVSENISFVMFFKLVLCTLPGISAIILPTCFLISSIVVIQKMHSNEEITVFLTSGKSPFSLFLPLLVLGVGISLCVFYLRTTISPMAYKTFEDMQEEVKNNISINLLKPGTFNIIGESVIYIGERSDDQLKNVFISYIPNNKKSHTNIISATSGKYVSDNGKILISLNNGYRQEFDKSNKILATLKFDNFSYDITPFFKRFYARPKRPNEKSQKELLEDVKTIKNQKLKQYYMAEYHSRYLFSVLPVLETLILAIFLIKPMGRGRGRKAVMKAFSAGILCQIFVIILGNISAKDLVIASYNYAIVAILFAILFVFFRYRG